MKLLWLFTFLPILALAQRAPTCSELEGITFKLEQELMSKTIKDCSTLSSEGLFNSSEDDSKKAVEDFRCSDLASLEMRIKNLEGEISLLQGFEKLKADLQAQKEKAGARDLKLAQKAAEKFTHGLETAQSMELLFSEGTTPEFLKSLKDSLVPLPEAKRNDPDIFMTKVKSLCSSQGSSTSLNACHIDFRPSSEALREINLLLAQDPSAEQMASWRESLAIKKTDDSAYSFNQMYKDLKDALPKIASQNATLTREELRALRSLPDFKDDKLKFLAALKDSKSELKSHQLMEEFKFLNEDLQVRQQLEMQAKISLAWKNISSQDLGLNEEQLAACQESAKDFEKARACKATFASVINGDKLAIGSTKTQLQSMLESLESSESFLKKLNDVKENCLKPDVLKAALETSKVEACEANFPDITNALAKKQNQIASLNALKEKMGQENTALLKFRNYAMETLAKNNCANPTENKVGEFCADEPALKVSREALVLTLDVAGIALVNTNPKTETVLTDECKEEKLPSYKKQLCESLESDEAPVAEDKPATRTVPSLAESDDTVEVKNPNRNNLVGQAWAQGGINLAGTILAGLLAPKNYGYGYGYNPYPYNYSPYYPPGGASISQSLLGYNAQFNGAFGFYTPTPGLSAYTAFPTYGSYSSIPSNYFTPYRSL